MAESQLPRTRREMLRAFYKQLNACATCKGCGAPIEWWQTTNGKRMPFNPAESEDAEMVPHWATCPKAKDFRTDSSAPTPEQNAAKRKTAEVDRLMRRIAEISGCHVVTVVMDSEQTYSLWRNDLSAEDLRSDLITAANQVRAEVQAQARKGTNA